MAKKAAKGSGSIRKKAVVSGGRTYYYWEARLTTGHDPATGRQVQRSFSGKTQREVREKMQAAAAAAREGLCTAPSRRTVGDWLDEWYGAFLCGTKPATRSIYENNIKNHLKPALGAMRLSELRPEMIQHFIGGMQDFAPASVRLAYKVLRQSLSKAVALGYIARNPADGCALPRMEQRAPRPLSDAESAALLSAARGEEIEQLVWMALFTGCRLSELLGLTWDCVESETVTINKQLARPEFRAGGLFLSTKNGKSRTLTPAPSVMRALDMQRRQQAADRVRAGELWQNDADLVFTRSDGAPLDQWRADLLFRRVADSAGLPEVHFHDLRHTYAVNAIRAGDDIKTVQDNLGHATAAFTLNRYAHFTDSMRQDSAARMEGFIRGVVAVPGK